MTIYGYRGKHLELTVPDLEVVGQGDDRGFADCTDGNLKSWVAPIDVQEGEGDAFNGYNDNPPRRHRGVLDPRREWHPPDDRGALAAFLVPEDVAEMRAILDSIRIEP